MNQLSDKQLIGLPVETQSGTALGKIRGFVVDADRGSIVQYVVKNTNPLRELFGKELLVASSQVISLTVEKMVVDDLAAAEKKRAPAVAPTTT